MQVYVCMLLCMYVLVCLCVCMHVHHVHAGVCVWTFFSRYDSHYLSAFTPNPLQFCECV